VVPAQNLGYDLRVLETNRSRPAFAIFITTLCQGTVPLWHDENGYPLVYETELEAQREIADDLLLRIQQFLDSDRDFDDAVTIEEFILPVDVGPDRVISIEDGSVFGKLE